MRIERLLAGGGAVARILIFVLAVISVRGGDASTSSLQFPPTSPPGAAKLSPSPWTVTVGGRTVTTSPTQAETVSNRGTGLLNLNTLATATTCSTTTPATASSACAAALIFSLFGTTPTLQAITVTPTQGTVEFGSAGLQLTATGTFSDGSTKNITSSVQWSSDNMAIVSVDRTGLATANAMGQTTVEASSGAVNGSGTLTVTPPGHFLFPSVGLYTQFERRGWASEYWSGQTIDTWNNFDSVVGSTVAQEVSLQLDAMKAMGVNTITFELRTADPTNTGSFTPPDCSINAVLGLQYPQPTQAELSNLPLLFDLAQSKGIKIWLRLVNTHMEEQPPTDNQTWLGAILRAIGKHPALDLVLFEGNTHTVNNGTECGIPAEPPLWLGPGSVPASYVQWAIGYAMSLGVPAYKLSAEAVVGDFFVKSQPPAGSDATDGHLWSPIEVEKTIFDNLAIPAAQRTYALSIYEHRKCSDAQTLPCTDLDPHDWEDQTLKFVRGVTGSAARVVAPEMGDMTPVDQTNWPTPRALESLVFLLHKYGLGGGSFWQWVNSDNSADSDPTLATPVKRRGTAFVYNPVQKEVEDMGGFHLPLVANGSFEDSGVSGTPNDWTITGTGTGASLDLTQEAGEPEVPSRGHLALRLNTGLSTNGTVSATSIMIPVQPGTTYTTTSNDRFAWSGDPAPSAPAASRPQVSINVLYFQADRARSSARTGD